MDVEIRPIRTQDVVTMAREQAERHEPLQHYFEPGSREAAAFERAYLERQLQLEEHEG